MTYFITKSVHGTFDGVVERVIAELKNEGFGVLTEIDVKATMKTKLDKPFRNYRILGACNPTLAFQALSVEGNIGVMLPCNVVVQEVAHGVIDVSAINPAIAMKAVGNESLMPIAKAVSEKLARVLAVC